MNPGEQKRFAISSTPSEVRLLAKFCRDTIADLFSEEDVASIELAIVEAANNIVKHAYKSEEGHPLQLSISHRGDSIELLFFDKGPEFNHAKINKPDFQWDNLNDIPERGWGVFLIKSIMDEVEYDRQGNINVLKMIKKFPSESTKKRNNFFDDKINEISRIVNDKELFQLKTELAESQQAINEMAEELSSAYESLNLFYSLSRDVALVGDLSVFLKNTLEKVIVSAEASWGVVRLKSNSKLTLYASTDKCPNSVLVANLSIDDSSTIEGKVASSLEAKVQDSYHNLHGQVICLPIVGLDEFLGTILLGKKKDEKAFSTGDSKLARAMADQLAVSIENKRLYSRAMDAELDKQEIQIATDLQQKLIIQKLPQIDNLKFYTKSEPAQQVGGDYLTLEKISDTKVYLVVCDAMGKGMSASYFSLLSHMAVHSILMQQQKRNIRPGQLLSMVNKVMFRDFGLFGMFMTCFIGEIDLEKNILSYASAGHCQPILFDNKHGVQLLDTMDFMMGVDDTIEYNDFYVDFLPKMKLLIYSDGLTDIVGNDGDIIGVDPLVKLCSDIFPENDIIKACDIIYDKILEISGNQLQDDISMIGVERTE